MRRLLAADVLLARLQGEHEAAPAVDVGGLAGDAAGHAAQVLLGARRRSRTMGPPKSSRLPSGWPSPTATSTPHSPGGRSTPSVIASTEATQSAPASWAAARERLEVLDRAEEVRVLHEERRGLVVERVRRARRRR